MICCSRACISSFVSALFNAKKMVSTRLYIFPLRSKATIVFSKVAFAGLLIIASISALCCLMASSNAGIKCSFFNSLKGNVPCGCFDSSKNGFPAIIMLVLMINVNNIDVIFFIKIDVYFFIYVYSFLLLF